jgi:hypothetical protein
MPLSKKLKQNKVTEAREVIQDVRYSPRCKGHCKRNLKNAEVHLRKALECKPISRYQKAPDDSVDRCFLAHFESSWYYLGTAEGAGLAMSSRRRGFPAVRTPRKRRGR